ncbi:MAG TPA: hypothetical protein VFB97_02885 [Bacteroidales bacterium]|nr:hypothetical protein [Bacteroidales bacterium]
MKALNLIGWCSLAIGVLIILFAAISLLTGSNIFGFGHLINYFLAADSFFLVTIALFIVVNRCECNKK